MSQQAQTCLDCAHRGTRECSGCFQLGIRTKWLRADAAGTRQEPAGAPNAAAAIPAPQPGANARQVGGDHYRKPIQPWDFIALNGIGYLEGNVIKYVSRWKDKNGVEDLRKARHYLDKLIELQGEGK